ncbi:hypothetical protein M9H77_02712 [Catharanthus roseus]|uniref:Uncharacterized protein n=1 Tax=Catharanthus roseus TaxID=4058 RepID=A0ACC0C949_CATRO|nr:hypothetical protein M9H77_02712 [Catharanthus roseus]
MCQLYDGIMFGSCGPLRAAHYLSSPHFSDVEGTSLEKKADFDKVTNVLTSDVEVVWPETNRLNSYLMKMPYKALFRVFCGNWLPTTKVTVVLKKRAHLLYAFATRKRINICTVIFKNILRQIDQKKASKIALPLDLSLPSDFWVKALHTLVMPKIIAPSVLLRIEVVLLFHGVEDLRRFKIKQLVPRESLEEFRGFNLAMCKGSLHSFSLEELKGFNCAVCEGRKGIQCRQYDGYGHIQAECANTLKKNKSLNTTLSDDDKKNDSEDDEEDTDSYETLAFNAIIDLEDACMYNIHKDDSNDDSIYSDEEVYYEELQDKYSLLYNKWLMAQIKDATNRIYVTEGKIARLNTGKAKLNEIITMGRPAEMKLGLGYIVTNLNHTTSTHVTQHESKYTAVGKLEGMFVKDSLSGAEREA